MYVLLLRLGFGCRARGFQNISLDRRSREGDDRRIPGFRALSRTHAVWTELARFRGGALWSRILSELFGGDEFGTETSPSMRNTCALLTNAWVHRELEYSAI